MAPRGRAPAPEWQAAAGAGYPEMWDAAADAPATEAALQQYATAAAAAAGWPWAAPGQGCAGGWSGEFEGGCFDPVAAAGLAAAAEFVAAAQAGFLTGGHGAGFGSWGPGGYGGVGEDAAGKGVAGHHALDDAAGESVRYSQTFLRRRRRQKAAGLSRAGAGHEPLEGVAVVGGMPTMFVPPEGGKALAVDEQLVRQLTKDVEAGGEAREVAIKSLRGNVQQRSMEADGCRLVQAVLLATSSAEAAELVTELHMHVSEMVSSPHANYVLQKVIEVMPAASSTFVAAELKGKGAPVSRHRFGCRILCRLLEHAASSTPTCELVEEVLEQVKDLTRHSFAHHVISAVLEHGLHTQQQKVISSLIDNLYEHAQNRSASYVIEKALSHARDHERDLIASALADCPQALDLAKHQFGSYVIRALLAQPCEARRRLVKRLVEAAPQLRGTKFGDRVLQDMQNHGLIMTAKPAEAT